MKNISVLPILVTIIFLFSVNNNAFSQSGERKYGFSIGPQFGFLYGQITELVHPTDTKGKYLSELIYEVKPIYYFGINLEVGLNDISFYNGFFGSLSFKIGLPRDSGIHQNRDWMSVQNSDLTHFSEHINQTDRYIQADLTLGSSLPVRYFYFKPFINFSWMNFSFTGKDGYGRYARDIVKGKTFYPIDDNPRKEDFSGQEVINYVQNWILLAPGCTVGTYALSPFYINLSFQISPFTYCTAVDQHFLKNTTYYDYTGWGLFIEGGGNISFKIKFFELSLEYAYRYIRDTKGITHMEEGNVKRLVANKSGAGISLMDTRVIAKIRF